MIEYKILTDKPSKQSIKKEFQIFFEDIYEQVLADSAWEHQFIHSPYEDSPLFLALDKGKIVGSALMIPQKFQTDSDKGSYYLWTTSAIHKDYRSKGLYAEILKMQREYTIKNQKDFIFAFPNKLAYPVVKLFGGFKDIYKTNLVKTTLDSVDFTMIKNTLFIDNDFYKWRFRHKEYLFYKKGNYILIAKEFDDLLDLLAIYTVEDLKDVSIPIIHEDIHQSIITLESFLKEDAKAEKLDTLNGTYFPINKDLDYQKLQLNLLMSDIF